MPDPARKVDAIRLPLGFGGPDGMARIQRRCAPLLGVDRVFIRSFGLPYNFVTPSHEDTLRYPSGHPRYPEERYQWVDMKNGVYYGYLKPETAGPDDAEPDLPAPTGPPAPGGTSGA